MRSMVRTLGEVRDRGTGRAVGSVTLQGYPSAGLYAGYAPVSRPGVIGPVVPSSSDRASSRAVVIVHACCRESRSVGHQIVA